MFQCVLFLINIPWLWMSAPFRHSTMQKSSLQLLLRAEVVGVPRFLLTAIHGTGMEARIALAANPKLLLVNLASWSWYLLVGNYALSIFRIHHFYTLIQINSIEITCPNTLWFTKVFEATCQTGVGTFAEIGWHFQNTRWRHIAFEKVDRLFLKLRIDFVQNNVTVQYGHVYLVLW